MEYVACDVMGIFYSVNFVVDASKQQWTVFVPTNEVRPAVRALLAISLTSTMHSQLIVELMRVWGERKYLLNMRKFSMWLVTSIKVSFSGSTITKADLQQGMLEDLIANEILQIAHRSARLIQQMIRDYLHHQRSARQTGAEEKVRRGRKIAVERVKAHSAKQAIELTKAVPHKSKKDHSPDALAEMRLQRAMHRAAVQRAQSPSLQNPQTNATTFKQSTNLTGSMDAGISASAYRQQQAMSNLVAAQEEIMGGNHNLEAELLQLRQELENQRLHLFYGRGIANKSYNGDEEVEDEDGRRMSTTRVSSAGGGKDGSKTSKEVKALKAEIEELHKQLIDMQTELFEQRRAATEAAQRAENVIQSACTSVEVAATRRVEAVKSQALDEMKSQLAVMDKQAAKQSQRQRAAELQREQELRKEISDKYQELELKLQTNSSAAQEQQELLRVQLAELKKEQETSLRRATQRRQFEIPPNNQSDDESPSKPKNQTNGQHMQRGKPISRELLRKLNNKGHSVPTHAAESTVRLSISKRPARSTKNIEWSRKPVNVNMNDEDDEEEEEEEDSPSEKAQRQAALEAAQAAAAAAAAAAAVPPPKKGWLGWLLSIRESSPAEKAPVPSAPSAPEVVVLPSSLTIRRLKRFRKKVNAQKELKNKMAGRLQHFVRFRLERRKMALNSPAKHLRKLALTHLLKQTTEKEIIVSALMTAADLNDLSLMQQAVDRFSALMDIYDYKKEDLPIDCQLLLQSIEHFLDQPEFVDKGLSTVFNVLKTFPEVMLTTETIPCLQDIVTTILQSNDEAHFVHLMVMMSSMMDISAECKEWMTCESICEQMRGRIEKYHKTDPDMLMVVLRFIISVTNGCRGAQERMGAAMICECVLMSLLHNYTHVILVPFHCRTLVNLCAAGCMSNQLLLGRGMYPNLLLNMAVVCRNQPALLVEVIRTMTSIFVNFDENKHKFQAVGCVELFADLLQVHRDHELLAITCLHALSCVALNNHHTMGGFPSAPKRQVQIKLAQVIKAHEGLEYSPAVREAAQKAAQRLQLCAADRPVTPALPLPCPQDVIDEIEAAEQDEEDVEPNDDAAEGVDEQIPAAGEDDVTDALEAMDFVEELPAHVGMSEHTFLEELSPARLLESVKNGMKIIPDVRTSVQSSVQSARDMLSNFRLAFEQT